MSSASIMTRIRVDDFDTWKSMFDRDQPRARESATGYTLYRGLEDANEVFIRVDFASTDDAVTARERLLSSRVLERFADRSGPTVVNHVDLEPAVERLDFNPTIGMVIEGAPPRDPAGEPWEVEAVFGPRMAGPPLHVHPEMEERFEVLSGVLDVFVDGSWGRLPAGESIRIPAGTPHTVRNTGDVEVRMRNVHDPALGFPAYMRRLHQLVVSGKVRSLPPRGPRSVIHLAMLFAADERTMVAVKPPQRLLRLLARVGRRVGYELP